MDTSFSSVFGKYRKAWNFSFDELSEMIDVGADEIEAWEEGKKEPGISQLRDLAMIFRCGVFNLMKLDLSPPTVLMSTLSVFGMGVCKNSDIDGYWGNVGIMLKGETKSKWYPISNYAMSLIYENMYGDVCDDWFFVPTLNNRLLVLHRDRVRKIALLPEAMDQPAGDWELPVEGCKGVIWEIYKGLDLWFAANHLDNDEWEGQTSEKYRETVVSYAERFGLDTQDYNALRNFLYDVKIYETNGDVIEIEAKPRSLYNLYMDIKSVEYDPKLRSFVFNTEDEVDTIFVPREGVALIDMPLQRVCEGFEEVHKEDENVFG